MNVLVTIAKNRIKNIDIDKKIIRASINNIYK